MGICRHIALCIGLALTLDGWAAENCSPIELFAGAQRFSSTLTERGRQKFEAMLRDNPAIDKDPLIPAVIRAIGHPDRAIRFSEKSSQRDPRWGVYPVRRSVDGFVRTEEGLIVIDVYNINARPLIPYEPDSGDNTTLKLIYAAQKILAGVPEVKQRVSRVQLRLSEIVNSRYHDALIQWGFIPDGKKALKLDLVREP